MKLGEAMVKGGLINDDQLAKALERQIIFGGRIGTNLVEMGLVAEEELARFLSKHLHVPYAEPTKFENVKPDVLEAMPRELAEKYTAFPIERMRSRLFVAMKDPNDMAKVDEMRFVVGMDIKPYIASEMRIVFALEKYYKVKRDLRYVNVKDANEGFNTKIAPSAVDIPSMPGSTTYLNQKMPEPVEEEYFLGDESQLEYGTPAGLTDGEAIANALEDGLDIPQEVMADIEPPVHDAPTVVSEAHAAPAAPVPMQPPFAEPVQTAPPPTPPAESPTPFMQPQAATPAQPAPQPRSAMPPYERLAAPADREDIGLAVIDAALSENLSRAALFTLKGEVLTGWHASGQGVDEKRVLSLSLALNQPIMFQDVLSDLVFFKGPVLQIPQNTAIIEALGGGFPREAVACPLVIKGKGVGVLYGDCGPDSMIASDVNRLLGLMQKASMSLEILILKTKILAGT